MRRLYYNWPPLPFKGDALESPSRNAHTVNVNGGIGVIRLQEGYGRITRDPIASVSKDLAHQGTRPPWASRNSKITNGDTVTIWCHSLGPGGWKSLQESPSAAYQAMYSTKMGDMKVSITKVTLSPVVDYSPAKYTIEFV